MSDKDQDAFKASGTSPTYRVVARGGSEEAQAGAVLERSRATVAARRRFTEVSSDCEDTAHAEPVKGLNRRAFLKSAGMTAVAGAVGTGTTSTQAELQRLDVVFPDKYLEDAVREVLEKPDGPLTREDLESLEKLKGTADMIVCSATPTEALETEWSEHHISQYVLAICGQEAGSKTETLGQAAAHGYTENHVLMIGDAPGDLNAAQTVGALFYPINPGKEESSWERFLNEACDIFLNGEYAGAYEKKLIAEFDTYLPEKPPWKK